MNSIWKLGVVAVAAVTVTACAGTELQEARKMQPSGSPYNVELSRGYLEMSKEEYGEGDYSDSDNFAVRSMTAGKGQNVAPEEIGRRNLPGDKVGELTAARQRLVAAQGKNAAALKPSDTARAQLMFDCWMQEQEENRQPTDIKACRDGFETAMARVEATAPAPAPAPVAMAPGDFLVFFDWDKYNITPEAAAILDKVAADAKKMGQPRLVATGHTDTSGSAEYNMGLSIRRANAVKEYLVEKGVPAANITTVGRGQEDPLVPTGDGVREPQNRRVQIKFEK